MTPSTVGLFAGLGLGFAGAFGGFDAFAICLLLAVVGFVVGRVLEGQIDLGALVASADRRGPVTAQFPADIADNGGTVETAVTVDMAVVPTAGGPDRAPGDRGETRIHDRVVERLVSASAAEVAGTGGTHRRVLGVPVSGAGRPVAQAEVNGNVVSARVSLSMSYPSPVRETAAEVRRRVSERVEQLTGLRVAEVDVVVESLEADVEPRVQ